MSSSPTSAIAVPGIYIDNGDSESVAVTGLSQSVPPDCYIEDLEHHGILPPSSLRGMSPTSLPTLDVVKRSASARDLKRESKGKIRFARKKLFKIKWNEIINH